MRRRIKCGELDYAVSVDPQRGHGDARSAADLVVLDLPSWHGGSDVRVAALSMLMNEQVCATAGDVTHLLVTARHCAGPLENIAALTKACVDAVNDVQLQIVAETSFAFTPHGATIVLLLAQSHVVVSTWPEHHLAIVDVTICGPAATASRLWRGIKGALKPGSSDVSEQHITLTPPES